MAAANDRAQQSQLFGTVPATVATRMRFSASSAAALLFAGGNRNGGGRSTVLNQPQQTYRERGIRAASSVQPAVFIVVNINFHLFHKCSNIIIILSYEVIIIGYQLYSLIF